MIGDVFDEILNVLFLKKVLIIEAELDSFLDFPMLVGLTLNVVILILMEGILNSIKIGFSNEPEVNN